LELLVEEKQEPDLPVVPPSETGVAGPPVEREGAEGASARFGEG